MIATLARRGAGAALCLLVMAAGCGRSNNDYKPSAAAARESLQAALAAWQGGQGQPGVIAGTRPAVQAVDSLWQSGRRLVSFEIVQEEPTKEASRKFLVRLTLEAGKAPEEVHYVVVGRAPIWVLREEDAASHAGM